MPESKNWLAETLNMDNDSRRKTLFVAIALCLVCSIIVASSAVFLRPIQTANQSLDRKRNILEVADLMEPGQSIDALFKQIETRIVDMSTGEYTEAVDAATYDARKAAKDPALSSPVPKDQDIASIKSKPDYAPVYLVKDGDAVKTVILPVHGYGLWSTLYGFLALEHDGNTVRGLKFYEHAETPGLGGEVDNPRWRALWRGKIVYDAEGQPQIEVLKGNVVTSSPAAQHQVDGLAGATLTSRGVTNLLRYWLGDQGFAPYLTRLRSPEDQS